MVILPGGIGSLWTESKQFQQIKLVSPTDLKRHVLYQRTLCGWATPQLTASAVELECSRCIPSCLVRSTLSVPPSGPCWWSGQHSWSVGHIMDSTLDRTPQKPEPGQDSIRYSNNTQTKGTKVVPTLAKAVLSDLKRMLSSVKGGASFRDWTITEEDRG